MALKNQILLQLQNIVKHFGGVTALAGVDLALKKGAIHGLIGENGAGKSTLIKIICGIETPDQGTMLLDNNSYTPHSPGDAKKKGVQVVHQELNLLPFLSVADNICFEHLPANWFGVIQKKKMEQEARTALDLVGLDNLSPSETIENLGIAQQQLIEIARALKSKSRILILDEPTATLTSVESDRLFKLVHQLAAEGVAILLVSHHLDEIINHCDEVTIMRNGRTIATHSISDVTIDSLIQAMIDRKIEATPLTKEAVAHKDVLMRVEKLRPIASPYSEGTSLTLHKGEIVGIAGLVGAGRTEFLRAIAGADKARSGHIALNGKAKLYATPGAAIRDGIALVSEDRRHEGLILPMPIATNITLADTKDISKAGILQKQKEDEISLKYGRELAIKYGKLNDPVSTLSGGNQQKVVLAKWMAINPSVLLLDEPTRGVDVGAKDEIYALMRDFAAKDKGLLVVSSEMRELIELCDRILVMAHHQIIGELQRHEYSQERILQLAYHQAA